MKRREFIQKSTLVVGAVLLPESWAQIAVAQSAIAQGGGAIVVAPDAPQIVRFAASELQKYIARATSARWPIIAADKAASGPFIYVGRSAATDALRLDAKELYPDGYLIRRAGNDLVILGDDHDVGTTAGFEFDPRHSRKGTLYGVYRFLEQQFGIRWLWPGESGEVVPTSQTLELTRVPEQRSKPAMAWRHLFLNGQSTLPPAEIHESYLWYLRQGMGVSIGNPSCFGHSWAQWLDGNKNFAAHPEWYALIDGERRPFYEDADGKALARGRQFCSSNPELIAYIVGRIQKQYSPDDDVIVSLSPNDGAGFCECEVCRALDRPELYKPDEGYNGIVLSDRIFTFVSEVARRVRQTHPRVRLGCFSYTFFRPAPRGLRAIEPNVVISFTQQSQTFYHDPQFLKEHEQRLGEWLKMGNQIVLRDYIAYIGQAAALAPMSRWIAGQTAVASQNAARIFGFYSETTFAGMMTNHRDFYLLGRLMWDPAQSAAAIKNDFLQHGFGQAAPAMEQFYNALEEAYCGVRDAQAAYLNGLDLWLAPPVIAAAREQLNAARAAADESTRPRVAIVTKTFEYTVALRDLMANNRKMTDAGLPMGPRGYTPQPPAQAPSQGQIMQMIEDGERAHQRVLALIAEQEKPDDGFIYCGDGFRRMEAVGRWGEALAEFRRLFQDAANQPIPLPLTWRFRLDPQKVGIEEKWHSTPLGAHWTAIDTDNPWEKQGYGMEKYGVPDGYNGLAWYRLDDVTIPAAAAGKRCTLWLGAVDESCKVFVNGRFAGEVLYDAEKDPDGWKKPLQFDITEAIALDKPNSIAVQVQDLSGQGGIWKPCWLMLTPKTAAAQALFRETFDDGDWQKKFHVTKSDDDRIERAAGVLSLATARGLLEKPLTLSWQIDDVAAGSTLRFQMRVRTKNLRENGAAKEAWQRRPQTPQVRIIPTGENHKVLVKPNDYQWVGLPFAAASDGWQTLARVFRAPPETRALNLKLMLNAPGDYEIDDIELQRIG